MRPSRCFYKEGSRGSRCFLKEGLGPSRSLSKEGSRTPRSFLKEGLRPSRSFSKASSFLCPPWVALGGDANVSWEGGGEEGRIEGLWIGGRSSLVIPECCLWNSIGSGWGLARALRREAGSKAIQSSSNSERMYELEQI